MRRGGFGIVVLLVVGGAGLAVAQSKAPAGIPDHDFSLARGSVFEVQAPPPVSEDTSFPGERPRPDRAHPEMPPVIPHGIADFLPVTRAENLCVDCHGVETREPGEPTPIPASHYVDLRHAPGRASETLAGARWVCTSCHVAQTDATPLVENRLETKPADPVE